MKPRMTAALLSALAVLTGLLAVTAPTAGANTDDGDVTLSIPASNGPEFLKTNGVAEVKLVNHTDDDQPLNCLTAATDESGHLIRHRESFIPSHVTFWLHGLGVGTWNFSVKCKGGASDQAWLELGPGTEQFKPKAEMRRFSCDEHGYASFSMRASNELSSYWAYYIIKYRGVSSRWKVLGTHGEYIGIDGIVKQGGDIQIIAKHGNAKPGSYYYRSWVESPPRCQPAADGTSVAATFWTKGGQCPQGGAACPPKFTCAVLGGYPGHCENNQGYYAEGYIDGCTTDLKGVKWWAFQHHWIRSGGIKFIFHKPVHDYWTFWNRRDVPLQDYDYDAGKQESDNRVTFSAIRDTHTPRARVVRAQIGCTCPQQGECKKLQGEGVAYAVNPALGKEEKQAYGVG